MEHQDFNTIVLSKKQEHVPKSSNKEVSQRQQDEDIKLEVPKKLGQLISQGRILKNKNQKEFSLELGISQQILSRWESGKENPNNSDIAKIEKVLGVRLPRLKKTKINNE